MQSDYRFRGYSVSGGKPAGILALSYDDPSGFYANESTIGALSHGNDPLLLGVLANAGYAHRITTDISIDGGITRTQYYHYAARATDKAHYTEFYGGLIWRGISAHVYLSPDYLDHGNSTAYGEVDALLKSFGPWRLNGHAGVLGYLSTPRYVQRSTQYDWRLGLSRQLGHLDLHASVSGGGPNHDFYRGRSLSMTALGAGASWIF